MDVPRILLILDRMVALNEERASISDSVLNLSLCSSVSSVPVNFRCSRARCLSTSDFRSSILVSFARLFANSSLTPVIAFSSPASSLLAWVTHGVDWLIINRRQGGLNLFCDLTCTVGFAGEVIEFDVFKVARDGFICLWSAFIAELLRPVRV